jgi:hypothetical protein
MPRRIGRDDNLSDDVTAQAGWLFADSFLGLMVIFLATISFVPFLITDRPAISGSGGNSDHALILVYNSYDLNLIESDIKNYIKGQGFDARSRVIYAQISGPYNSKLETERSGYLRALTFGSKLKQVQDRYFQDLEIKIAANPSLKPSEVMLRLTLGS